jgi:hypothetical protein
MQWKLEKVEFSISSLNSTIWQNKVLRKHKYIKTEKWEILGSSEQTAK